MDHFHEYEYCHEILKKIKHDVDVFIDHNPVVSEEGRDLKTKADHHLEAVILKQLAKFPFKILSEESLHHETIHENEPVFILDPLDGTANFTRKIPFAGVSLGFWKGPDNPIFGFIYSIYEKAIYRGYVGHGAFFNDKPIEVSKINNLKDAILSTGFPLMSDLSKESLELFFKNIGSFKKVRMLGCASLSLALLARGAIDSHYEENTMLWDVAAGIPIVRAAGGLVEFTKGKSKNTLIVKGTNGLIPF